MFDTKRLSGSVLSIHLYDWSLATVKHERQVEDAEGKDYTATYYLNNTTSVFQLLL